MRNLPTISVRSQDTRRNNVLNMLFDVILGFGATSHICTTMQAPSDDERFIFVGDKNKVVVEAIGTFRLPLKTGFHFDLFETFVVPPFSLYQNSNVIGYDSLIDNLYMCDVLVPITKYCKLAHERIQRLVSVEILEPLDLSNFKICVECIKEKRTNIRKLGFDRTKDVLELIYTCICGPFPTTSWNGQQYFITFIDDYFRSHNYTVPRKPNMNGGGCLHGRSSSSSLESSSKSSSESSSLMSSQAQHGTRSPGRDSAHASQ
ncbi:hypothetical protein CR513_60129, partial [Mucuna pruriens]